MTPTDISAAQARRIALVAQGFADRRPAGAVTLRHLDRVVGRTRLVQMDSVNVAVRAHYLPLFSRLGAYDRTLLDRAAWRPGRGARRLTEYWAHEAALIPVEDWPLFAFRMADYRDGRYRHTRDLMRRHRALAADVRAVIDEVGASTPRRIEDSLGIERSPRRSGGWWDRGEVKHLCEAMFAAGDLAATRDESFGRHYDLTERIVGADIATRVVERSEAIGELVVRAASAHGIATVADLADYYRLKPAEIRSAVADLVDAGAILPVRVENWRDEAYLHAEAAVPSRVRNAGEPRSAILSPFDPLVFYRPRTERVFGFHYRIEIYVPAPKRVHGYYVHRTCSATISWPASTSRPTAPGASYRYPGPSSRTATIPMWWRTDWPPTSPRSPNGWGSRPSRSEREGHSHHICGESPGELCAGVADGDRF